MLHSLCMDLLQSKEYLSGRELIGIINNKTDNCMSSGNAVLKFEVLKYFRSQI
jgi:hypothetical protein